MSRDRRKHDPSFMENQSNIRVELTVRDSPASGGDRLWAWLLAPASGPQKPGLGPEADTDQPPPSSEDGSGDHHDEQP